MSPSTNSEPPEAGRSLPTAIAARRTVPAEQAESLPSSNASVWKVDVLSSSGTRSIWLWSDDEVSIGRAATQRLRVDCPSVSREHAVLRLGENGAAPPTIQDHGSHNGTFVDGRRLAPNEACLLGDGARVQIGLTTLLVRRESRSSVAPSPLAKSLRVDGNARASFVIRAPQMIDLYARARSVATSDLPVLILGETGVGKEHLAETIHEHSPRRHHRLVRINCAALTMTLLEAELFGHERGAFTGATTARAGLVEAAEGGTLFLDEIGDLPFEAQAKLLRTLEVGEYFRVGSTIPRRANVRFVSATHRDLTELVRQGLFRADLFHRLHGIALRVPPLRERVVEQPELIRVFASLAASRVDGPVPVFEGAAIARVGQLPWPGNVRELRRFLERWMALERPSVVRLADVERWIRADQLEPLTSSRAEQRTDEETAPATTAGHRVQPSLDTSEDTLEARLRSELDRLERERIVAALQQCGGNQREAARVHGVSRRTFINRLEALKIPRPRKRLS
jgi:two-component system, NtrC family, response regulator AtoC